MFDVLAAATKDAIKLGAIAAGQSDEQFWKGFKDLLQQGIPGEDANDAVLPVIGIAERKRGEQPFEVGAKMFKVHHYAKTVRYDASGFVERNKDDLSQVAGIVASSEQPWLERMRAKANKEADISEGEPRRAAASNKECCVASSFADAVDGLIDHLRKTRAHYVRCVKPNDAKKAGIFERSRVYDQ